MHTYIHSICRCICIDTGTYFDHFEYEHQNWDSQNPRVNLHERLVGEMIDQPFRWCCLIAVGIQMIIRYLGNDYMILHVCVSISLYEDCSKPVIHIFGGDELQMNYPFTIFIYVLYPIVISVSCASKFWQPEAGCWVVQTPHSHVCLPRNWIITYGGERLDPPVLRTPSPKKQGPPEEKTFFAALRHGWTSVQRAGLHS